MPLLGFFDGTYGNYMNFDPTIFYSIVFVSYLSSIHTTNGNIMPISYIGPVSTSHISLPETYRIPKVTL